MTKLQQDFTIWSGDNKTLTCTVTDATTGASVNLTGASVAWVLANSPTSGSILRLSTDDFVTVSGCTFSVALAASHTAGLSGQYYHEGQIRESTGNVSTVTVGTVTINQDVAGQ